LRLLQGYQDCLGFLKSPKRCTYHSFLSAYNCSALKSPYSVRPPHKFHQRHINPTKHTRPLKPFLSRKNSQVLNITTCTTSFIRLDTHASSQVACSEYAANPDPRQNRIKSGPFARNRKNNQICNMTTCGVPRLHYPSPTNI